MLAILAGLAAAVATRGTGPSDELLLTRAAAELRAEIARARLGAARGGASVTLSLPAADCEGEVKEVRIFANGTVEGATTCLVAGDRRAILRLDGLTGGLERVEDD